MRKDLKILILEDSVADAELIQFELKNAKIKFEAKVVSTRGAFIRELKKFQPNFIISDFSLPGFDGYSALRIVRRKGLLVPFIFVSGTIGEERATESLKKGATDYVLKDHIKGLVPKIKRALNEFREREEKILVEKRLKKSEMRLAEAQRVARIGNWEFNLLNKKTTWSDEVFQILGFPLYSVTPNDKIFYSLLHPDDRDFVINTVNDAILRRKELDYSCRIIHNESHQVRYIQIKAKFRDVRVEKADKVFGIIQDITELKNVELKLENTNNELKTFIYKASHDIRGPLSSSIGLCTLAQRECEKFPETIKYFEMINDRMQNLDYIVCSLLEVMAMKDSVVKIEKINFNNKLKDILKRLEYTKGYSRVTFEISNRSTDFYSVHTFVHSIFQNLIENAIKYQNFNISNPKIKIAISQSEKGVNIELADNGIGINDKIKDNVFDMFYRGNTESKGTGLGLYIVKSAVERLKGTIVLNTTSGKGCNFKLFLPNLYANAKNTVE